MDAVPYLPPAPGLLAGGRRQLRRGWRLLQVLAHIGTGFVLACATGALFVQHRPRQRRAARWWLRRLTRILGLDIECSGRPEVRPALYIANHVSWLDIPVLGGVVPVHFLSKAEVAEWPLIGRLATAAGTLYIRRGHGQVRERARQIGAHLRAGRGIVVFPEGTSTDGSDVRTFHAPLFAAATDGGHRVQPVAIRYLATGGSAHPLAPFIGDDEFHTHLWRLLGEDRIRVQVHFLPPVEAGGLDHKLLANEVQRRIRAIVTGGARIVH